jgi:hypothetical protein
MTGTEYQERIRSFDYGVLLSFWSQICNRDTTGWPSGKAFEYFILRAFELEGANIRWPFGVKMNEDDEEIEQIDGVIHFPGSELSVMVECKDYDIGRNKGRVSIDPVSKMRNQLLRRPSNLVGAVFTTSEFTHPAIVLAQYTAPQTILLWEKEDVEFCLKHQCFIKGFRGKYWHALEEGFPNLTLRMENFSI